MIFADQLNRIASSYWLGVPIPNVMKDPKLRIRDLDEAKDYHQNSLFSRNEQSISSLTTTGSDYCLATAAK